MAGDFDFEYGIWSVQHRRLLDRLAGCLAWEEFDGTASCAPILGGVGNIEEASMPSTGTIGMALRLFDQTTRLWSIYWSTSLTGQLEPPVVGRFEDGVGVFEGDDEFRGEPIRVRFVWDQDHSGFGTLDPVVPSSSRLGMGSELGDDLQPLDAAGHDRQEAEPLQHLRAVSPVGLGRPDRASIRQVHGFPPASDRVVGRARRSLWLTKGRRPGSSRRLVCGAAVGLVDRGDEVGL